MTWITHIPYDESTGELRELYDRIKGPDGNVDNIMLAHSLRPHTMQGHMTLYKYVLHHPRNTLPKRYLETIGVRYLETIGVYVSLLNRCDYCVEHHFAGLSRLLGDEERAAEIRTALAENDLTAAFSDKDLAGLRYAEKLTLSAGNLTQDDVAPLRAAGFDDGEVLELNQVTAYFAYANRTVLGLGIDTAGDIIGLLSRMRCDGAAGPRSA
jgi:uncharacterized peroxidase-related enzyme